MSKYKVTYEDLPYVKANGQTTYYNLTMAGNDLSKPTTFVLEKSKLAPDQSMAELDRPVIMGLSKATGREPDQIAVFSERDHERYDLTRLEVRARDPETKEPLYAERRDHGALFTKDDVQKYVDSYEARATERAQIAEQQKLYEQAKSQDEEFKGASIQSPQSRLAEKYQALELERGEMERE